MLPKENRSALFKVVIWIVGVILFLLFLVFLYGVVKGFLEAKANH